MCSTIPYPSDTGSASGFQISSTRQLMSLWPVHDNFGCPSRLRTGPCSFLHRDRLDYVKMCRVYGHHCRQQDIHRSRLCRRCCLVHWRPEQMDRDSDRLRWSLPDNGPAHVMVEDSSPKRWIRNPTMCCNHPGTHSRRHRPFHIPG